jgi:dTDP-4-dehydrorhamnose 3,5-epimerase
VITPLSYEKTDIDGLYVITMKQITDERGTIREFYRRSAWEQIGLPVLGDLPQINLTESVRGAVRGLHGEAMTKLVAIASGVAFGAYLDTRPDSPTVGTVVTLELTAGTQVLVPNAVCNGFQTLTETSQYLYCFDSEWVAGMAGRSVNALDPGLAIDWPLPPVLSDKDAGAPRWT